MKARLREWWHGLQLVGAWVLIAAAAVLVAFQLFAVLVTLGLWMVQTPALRPPGWNTHTIHGLQRFLWLVLGGAWLGGVMFIEPYLREAAAEGQLRRRVLRLLLALGLVYVLSYAVLLLFR